MFLSPKIIVITGIDGSGKTTISSLLATEIQRRNKKVKIVQQFAPNFIAKKIINRYGSKLISFERNVSDNQIFYSESRNESLTKTIFRKLAIFRIISFGFLHTITNFISNIDADVIVSDRYFYDNILKINWMYDNSYNPKWLSTLVPKPCLIVYLDVPAEVGWNREIEGNTTLEQHISKKKVYDEFFIAFKRNNWPILKVDAQMQKEEILNEILNKIDFVCL